MSRQTDGFYAPLCRAQVLSLLLAILALALLIVATCSAAWMRVVASGVQMGVMQECVPASPTADANDLHCSQTSCFTRECQTPPFPFLKVFFFLMAKL